MYKVNNKETRTTPGVVLVSLLLTLNIFHILFQSFYCWLWTFSCLLGIKHVFILQFCENISSLLVFFKIKYTRILGISYYTMKEAKQYLRDINKKWWESVFPLLQYCLIVMLMWSAAVHALLSSTENWCLIYIF